MATGVVKILRHRFVEVVVAVGQHGKGGAWLQQQQRTTQRRSFRVWGNVRRRWGVPSLRVRWLTVARVSIVKVTIWGKRRAHSAGIVVIYYVVEKLLNKLNAPKKHKHNLPFEYSMRLEMQV